MEIGRTKGLNKNSYKDSIKINLINWNKKREYEDVVKYLKELIEFRKTHRSIRINNHEIVNNGFKLLKEEEYLHYYYSEEEYVITNQYKEIIINDCIINKPGVYIFKDKKRVL